MNESVCGMCVSVCLSFSLKLFMKIVYQYEYIILCIVFMLSTNKKNRMECRLQHPFTCMISWMTESGKTYLVKQILQSMHQSIFPPPDRSVWIYAQDQPVHHELEESIPCIEFVCSMPENINEEGHFNIDRNNVLVLDDMMTSCKDDDRVTKLFSTGSQHKNLSIFYLVQNLLNQGKEMRNISLNTHYLIVFKNPRDNQPVSVLVRQMYPSKTKFFMEAFEDATSALYGYLFPGLETLHS